MNVRIPTLRANRIKDPHQVRLPGDEAEVPVAKVERLCHWEDYSGIQLTPPFPFTWRPRAQPWQHSGGKPTAPLN
jgi:hypothetical protein